MKIVFKFAANYNNLKAFNNKRVSVIMIDNNNTLFVRKTTRQIKNEKRKKRLFYKGIKKQYPYSAIKCTLLLK